MPPRTVCGGHPGLTVKPQKSLLVLVITLMLAFVQRGSVAFLLYAHWFLATCTSGHYVRTAQSPSTAQVIELLKTNF